MNLAQQAKNVASAGRMGDTTLLHLNRYELNGIASMMPLTINPDTGYAEAFLPALAIPILMGALAGGGSSAISGGGMGDIAKGALVGGAIGGVTGGIGSALAPAASGAAGGTTAGVGAGTGAGAAGAGGGVIAGSAPAAGATATAPVSGMAGAGSGVGGFGGNAGGFMGQAAAPTGGGGIMDFVGKNKMALAAAGVPAAMSMLGGSGGSAPKKKDPKDAKRYTASRDYRGGQAPSPTGVERDYFSNMRYNRIPFAHGGMVYAGGGMVGGKMGLGGAGGFGGGAAPASSAPSPTTYGSPDYANLGFDTSGIKAASVGGASSPSPTTYGSPHYANLGLDTSGIKAASVGGSGIQSVGPGLAALYGGGMGPALPPQASAPMTPSPVFGMAPNMRSETRGYTPDGGIIDPSRGGTVSPTSSRIGMQGAMPQPMPGSGVIDPSMGGTVSPTSSRVGMQGAMPGAGAPGGWLSSILGGTGMGNIRQMGASMAPGVRTPGMPGFNRPPVGQPGDPFFTEITGKAGDDYVNVNGSRVDNSQFRDLYSPSGPGSVNGDPTTFGGTGMLDALKRSGTPTFDPGMQGATSGMFERPTYGWQRGMEDGWQWGGQGEGRAHGGLVHGYADGGIASMAGGQGGADEITMGAMMAIKGTHPDPKAAIRAFIEVYGPEAFEALMQQVMSGQGDGLSDSIPAVNPDGAPAALSEGEYVMPSDVVSGLGNGSTEAGGRGLDSLVQNVRGMRGGNPAGPDQIDPNMMMPV